MSNELKPYQQAAVATARPLILSEVLSIEAEQRRLLASYVRQHMIEGADFGVIPGTQKPTLLKPGAEKLVDLFRCTPIFEIIERVEDWDKPLFHYLFRVRIESRESGLVVAEGFGSANSREGRYRWRNGERLCPKCGKPTIIKGKAEFGGGWICFAKKGGCGAKFSNGDKAVEGQEIGRVENDDIFTLTNTILKMAKKRALVDAAIALARCSDIFTQDVEDLGSDEPIPATPDKPTESTEPTKQPSNSGIPANGRELHRRLREADTQFASEGLCHIGSLLAYVTTQGVKAGYGADLNEWEGPAIELAITAVRQFKANLPPAKVSPKTLNSIAAGLAALKWQWADPEVKVKCATIVKRAIQPDEQIDDRTEAEGQVLLNGLRAEYERKAREGKQPAKTEGAAS